MGSARKDRSRDKMKGSMFNMSQDILFSGGEMCGRRTSDKTNGFNGTVERNVSQGDILDTSLNLKIYCVPLIVMYPDCG